MASKADAVWMFRGPTSFWAANPHHPIPRVVVGFLEFVIDRRDCDRVAAMFQVVAHRFDVRRPAAVKPQERKDADLTCHAEQLVDRGNMIRA